jgi:hypothetical protein
VLLLDGLNRFSAGARGAGLALAAAEVTVSVLVLVFFASAVRQHRAAGTQAHASHRVDWLDIVLAVMFAIEAAAHRQETGHLPRPTVLLSVLMLGLGVFHAPFERFAERHRSLSVDDHGLRVGGRFFRKFNAAWSDITAIDIDDAVAHVTTRAGRARRLDLADLSNGAEVRAALTEARRRWRAALEPAGRGVSGGGSGVNPHAAPG